MVQDSPNADQDDKGPMLNRTGKFLLYYQTEGLCQALRLLVQAGSAPGPATIQLVKAVRVSADRLGQGPAFEMLPQISDEPPIADLLVVAEVIRTLMLAFLTPEEIESQRQTFGFGRR